MTTRMPQPPPLPAQPAHRRHRGGTSSSSSFSSSSSSLSAAFSSPSPRTTSVPFSWEHHPGIPKNCSLGGGADPVSSPRTPLPLPPPLRRRANRPAPPGTPGAADPFAAALAECTRERAAGGGTVDIDALFRPRTPASAAGRAVSSRRWSVVAGGVVGFLDLYGCKNAMAVAEGAFVVRRPVVAAVTRTGPGRVGRVCRRQGF